MNEHEEIKTFWSSQITGGAPFLVNVTTLKPELQSKLQKSLSNLWMLKTPTNKHLELKKSGPLRAPKLHTA